MFMCFMRNIRGMINSLGYLIMVFQLQKSYNIKLVVMVVIKWWAGSNHTLLERLRKTIQNFAFRYNNILFISGTYKQTFLEKRIFDSNTLQFSDIFSFMYFLLE
jgi:hypothetical protein